MKSDSKKIAVIGLGLMGGSLAAACRRKFPDWHVTGVSRQKKVISAAMRKGWIHEGTVDVSEGCREADLVVICTPVDTCERLLRDLEACCRRKTLVTDVGSVKSGAVAFYRRRKWQNIVWVPAHPMVGSHERGLEAARPGLYEDSYTFVIQSGRRTSAFRQVSAFWKKISPRVVEVTAARHDRLAARMSHLPHAAAMALVLAAGPEALKLAASGFRDATRLAMGDASVWAPIFKANRRELERALDDFQSILKKMKSLLRSGDDRGVVKMLQNAAKKRT